MKPSNVSISARHTRFRTDFPIAPSNPSKHAQRRQTGRDGRYSPELLPLDLGVSLASPFIPQQPQSLAAGLRAAPVPIAKGAGAPTNPLSRDALPMPFVLQQPEEQTDNWDDDFEEGISLTKLQGVYQYLVKPVHKPISIICDV